MQLSFLTILDLQILVSAVSKPVLHAGWFATVLPLLGLQLVERRGQSRTIHPHRQVDISTLLESIPDAVFLFDNGGRLVDMNTLAEQLCGRRRQQLRDISIAELNQLLGARDETDSPVATSSMGVNRALNGETVHNARRVFRHPETGRIVEAITSANAIREADGSTRGALLIVRDVTEVAQLQRRLADTQRHKEIGQMAAGLAHDFANVLDTIEETATLLEMESEKPPADRRAYTGMIHKAVERGAEIIDRVREYLRTGTGHQSEVDLRDLVRDVLDLTHPLWHGKRSFRLKTELLEVGKVCGNAADLRRVFTNLVINALEAMPEGGQLSLRCEEKGDHVRVTLCDTGQGIAPEEQKQLFVPYFTTKPQGTGLGLSGAQRIVNSLGGQIWFRSEPGKGTTFYVEIPLATARKAQRQREKGSPAATPGADANRSRGSRLHTMPAKPTENAYLPTPTPSEGSRNALSSEPPSTTRLRRAQK